MRKGKRHAPGAARNNSAKRYHIPEEPVDMELNLHGYAIDEALLEVEQSMKSLVKARMNRLRVIHGQPKGEKRTIYKEIQRNLNKDWRELVERFYQEPHNSGATILVLKLPLLSS